MKAVAALLLIALTAALAQTSAQSFTPGEQRLAFKPSPDQPAIYVFYFGTNSGEYQFRVAFTNVDWVTATNELLVGVNKTNLVGGVTNFITATSAVIQGTNFVEGPPAVEINYVPPRPPGMIRLSTTIMRSDNPLGPWTDVTNLQTIELAADANQGFYRSRMDVK